jgi:uncharacterized membrane protein (DUF106 family)
VAFNSFFDSLFGSLIDYNILLAVVVIAFCISLLMTLVYKWMTDQHLMKSLREDIKGHQKEAKDHRHDPSKMMEINKLAMEKNMKYMMHSMKPTLITFIPIIIIFGWMSSTLALIPLYPTMEFGVTIQLDEAITGDVQLIVPGAISVLNEESVNGQFLKSIENNQVVWNLKGNKAGEYVLDFVVNDKKYGKEVLITTSQKYKNPVKKIGDGTVKMIQISQKPLKILNLFGWKLGWLGTYILSSIAFSMGIRKLLKLH